MRSKALVVLLVTVALTGCKETAKVHVMSDALAPTFSFGDGGAPVRSLTVMRYCLEREKVRFEQKWMISRATDAGAVEAIKYGVLPTGFNEEVRPSLLQPGELYQVEVSALRTDYAALFAIQGRDGALHVVNITSFDGMSFEDWLKGKRDVFDVSCRGQKAV